MDRVTVEMLETVLKPATVLKLVTALARVTVANSSSNKLELELAQATVASSNRPATKRCAASSAGQTSSAVDLSKLLFLSK